MPSPKTRLPDLLLPLELAKFRAGHLREILQTTASAHNWSASLRERTSQVCQQANVAHKELATEFKRQRSLGARLTVFYAGKRPLHALMFSHTEAFELVHPRLSDDELFLANRVARTLAGTPNSFGRKGTMKKLRAWLRTAEPAALQKALRGCSALDDLIGNKAADVMLTLKAQALRVECLIVSNLIESGYGTEQAQEREPPGRALGEWVGALERALEVELHVKALASKRPPPKDPAAPGSASN